MSDATAVSEIWRYPIKSMMGESLARAEVGERGVLGDRAYGLVDRTGGRVAAVRTWAAELLQLRAVYAEEPRSANTPSAVQVTAPDGVVMTTADPGFDAWISGRFGRTLELMAKAPPGLLMDFPPGTLAGRAAEQTEGPLAGLAPAGTFFDVAAIHIIAAETLEALAPAEGAAADVRRFRPNLVVSGAAAFEEGGWSGRTLRIGESLELKVVMPCPRCVNVTHAQDGLPRAPRLLKAIAERSLIDLGGIGALPCAGVYAQVVRSGPVEVGDALRWLD